MRIRTILMVLVPILLAGACYSYANTTRSDGIEAEFALSAQYESNQNELSSYISSFYEQLGIANRKSAVLDTILSNAVQGRYGEDGFSANGSFFSAVTEAYPDLSSNLNLYDRILDHVKAGREQFKGKQNQLLDRARVYKVWLNDGFVRSLFVKNLGFPSDNLEARVGGKVVATGKAALDQMQVIVLTGSTVKAFETGTQEPLTTVRDLTP